MTLSQSVTPPGITPLTLGAFSSQFFQVNDVVPWTTRSSMQATGLLEAMSDWLANTLPDYLTVNFGGLESSWESQIGILLDAVNAAIADQQGQIDSAVGTIQAEAHTAVQSEAAALLASSDASTDPAIMAVVNNTATAFRQFLDTSYLANTNGALDTKLAEVLAQTTSQVKTVLDGWYKAQTGQFSDAALNGVLNNAQSASRAFLDLQYQQHSVVFASTATPRPAAPNGARGFLSDIGYVELVGDGANWHVSRGRDVLTDAQRAALPVNMLVNGYEVHCKDTNYTWRYYASGSFGTLNGWYVWPSSDLLVHSYWASATDQTVVANGWTDVAVDTDISDRGIRQNTTQFKIPVTGRWSFYGRVALTADENNSRYVLGLTGNGDSDFIAWRGYSGAYSQNPMDMYTEQVLPANQLVRFRIYRTSTGGQWLCHGNNQPNLRPEIVLRYLGPV